MNHKIKPEDRVWWTYCTYCDSSDDGCKHCSTSQYIESKKSEGEQMTTRKEQIIKEADFRGFRGPDYFSGFLAGAEWADANPCQDPTHWSPIILNAIKELEAKLSIATEALEFYSCFNVAKEALEKIK